MIWLLLAVYLLAAATVGRMAYEFDVFAEDVAEWAGAGADQALAARRAEIVVSFLVGVFWPVVPLFALWVHVKTPR